MLFSILTLFPEAIESYQDVGILGIARARGLLTTRTVNFRDFARDRHRTVDDRPFGGGPGMVLKPEPITEAIEWIEQRHGPHRRIALTPDGAQLTQRMVEDLAAPQARDAEPLPILLMCGRYEGFDERILELHEFERLSIGDYVLAGGELPALVLLESVARLIPGVLGDGRSAQEDSFSAAAEGGLDHPHYTRPRVYRDLEVPGVLLDGDHSKISSWRRTQREDRTSARRPDLSGGREES
ncbi:MAG: tRNA (guanosine(37)-N1)-methyltransferase TrmD [Planctomycetota bacterium]|nr:tRNA (guanosine(37)-N1)-methyltransferase TrmD [Planctomycetota bacterium]